MRFHLRLPSWEDALPCSPCAWCPWVQGYCVSSPTEDTPSAFFFWVQKLQSPGRAGWSRLLQADAFLQCVWDPSCLPPSPYFAGTLCCCASVFTRSRWGTSLHFGISFASSWCLFSLLHYTLVSTQSSDWPLLSHPSSLLQVSFRRKAFKKEWRYTNILNPSYFFRAIVHSHNIKLPFSSFLPSFSLLRLSPGHERSHSYSAVVPLFYLLWAGFLGRFSWSKLHRDHLQRASHGADLCFCFFSLSLGLRYCL